MSENFEERGEFIEMGNCATCGKPWGMYESEKRFFENLVKTQDYKMPKRCPTCREQKRKMKEGQDSPVSLPIVINRLHQMAHNASEGAYSLHDENLVKDLKDVANSLQMFLRQNKASFEKSQETTSVAQGA